jgi:hypothetical protein
VPRASATEQSIGSPTDRPAGACQPDPNDGYGCSAAEPRQTQNDRVGASGAAPKLAIRRQVGVGCALTIPSTQVRQASGRQRTPAGRALASGMAAAFVGPSYIAPSGSPGVVPLALGSRHRECQ